MIDTIRIGTFNYKVIFNDYPILLNNQEVYGLITYDKHEIKINNSLGDKQHQVQTLLHEVLHGIIREYDVDIKDLDEEILVDKLSTALYQLLKDNNELINIIEK